MEQRRRQFLMQLNRVAILVLSVFGMSMDGFEAADAVLALALVIWLWMPLCIKLESRVFGKSLDDITGPRHDDDNSQSDGGRTQPIHPNPKSSTS